MNLLCYGTSHEEVEVELRETLALSGTRLTEFSSAFHEQLPSAELAVLSTCNRVELYAAGDAEYDDLVQALQVAVEKVIQPRVSWREVMKIYEDSSAARHLFQVAAGMKSMVLGETEILGQVKQTYDHAFKNGYTGKYLNKLFQTAFSAAKEIRSKSAITRGSISVGSVSVELAERIFGELRKTKVLVLGAGETSERVLKSLAGRGVKSIIVANRTYQKACDLAKEFNGEAVKWDQWEKVLLECDIIISSTAAPHYVLKKEDVQSLLSKRNYESLFIIDLAVPRDIDPKLSDLDSIFLYDIDDIQSLSRTHMRERELEIEKCHNIIKKYEDKFMIWMQDAVLCDDEEFRSLKKLKRRSVSVIDSCSDCLRKLMAG
ncbi:MAG: glutamyl-tRNA reductase [Verrucomicrobiota bacterium]